MSGDDVMSEGELVLLTPRERLALVVLRRVWEDDAKGRTLVNETGCDPEAAKDLREIAKLIMVHVAARHLCQCGSTTCTSLVRSHDELAAVAPLLTLAMCNTLSELGAREVRFIVPDD